MRISSNPAKAWKARKIEDYKRKSLTFLSLKIRFKRKSSISIIRTRNSPRRKDILTFPYQNSQRQVITLNMRWKINNLLSNQIYQSRSFLEKSANKLVLVTINQYRVSRVAVDKAQFTMNRCQQSLHSN